MTRMAVIKIGGSLLCHEDIERRTAEWCEQVGIEEFLVVLGGGWLADGVRLWGEHHDSCDERLHFMAIECMSINTVVSNGIWPLSVFHSPAAWRHERHHPRRGYFDCGLWSQLNQQLPRNWNTTSDSIAAALAIELEAEQLILLKSRFPTPAEKTANWFRSELVDGFFHNLAPSLKRLRVVRVDRSGFSELV